jgi:protein-tyrosine-phosphatase
MDKTAKGLFLSTGDASRAQIAEGFLGHLCGDKRCISDPEVVVGGPEAKKEEFRQIRDQIKLRVQELIASKPA